jgi:hypothetical protein
MTDLVMDESAHVGANVINTGFADSSVGSSNLNKKLNENRKVTWI